MDFLKLFALLFAVASVQVTAEGHMKTIRIHLPQKVKHIHHHKKIYITNHPAPSQYAPAFLSGVKGAVALSSNDARSAVASYVPINTVELYDEARSRLPGVSPAASKLLPLAYRARGHYGPNHSEWNKQEYDLAPPPEPNDFYAPSGYAVGPTAAASPPKKVKIIKINELPRKKVIRQVKPKRVIVRGRPHPPPPPPPQPDEELPVSSFHEQFYSDLEEAGTIRKIKKPQRIEKIIDGDTEHIHTFSEEHIHKVVFDDDSKVTGVVGLDPNGSMGALNAAHPLVPLKNTQTLVAFPPGSLSDLAVMGSMGTSSHLEYAAYNPRDVTHDHIFHDHGEVPPGVNINMEGLRLPPKVSYKSHSLRVQDDTSKLYQHRKRYHSKPTKGTHDFSYYESMYSPYPTKRPKKLTHYDSSSETIKDFRPIPAFRFKDKRKTKTRNYGYKKLATNFQIQQASVPAPFSVSSTVVHDYDPKYYGSNISPAEFSKYRDPLIDFKDSYSNDFDYDNYASSSNTYISEDKTAANSSRQGKGKKSVSTQNISFGGQDRQTFVDHLAAAPSSNVPVSIEASPSALEDFNDFVETTASEAATTTPNTINQTSPAHEYYNAMALKALDNEETEVSDDNLQYAAPSIPSTEPYELPLATTTSQTIHLYKIQSTDAIPQPEYTSETRLEKKGREKYKGDHRQRYNTVFKELMAGFLEADQPSPALLTRHSINKYFHSSDSPSVRGNPKYGDKI